MIKGIDKEVIKSDLSEDTQVWFILDTAKESEYILSPDIDREFVLWLFLKKEDAEHFAHMAMTEAPIYKGKELIAGSTSLTDIYENIDGRQEWELIGPNEAKKFFEEYEETLPNYYDSE